VDHVQTVLLVEDNPGDARLIAEMLADAAAEMSVEHAETLAAAVARLEAVSDVDVVLLDLSLPDSEGLSTFRRLQVAAPRVAVIVLSGNTNSAEAAQTVRDGAQDFLVKGRVDGELLARAISYAYGRKQSQSALHDSEVALLKSNELLKRTVFDFAASVGKIVEARDPYTQGHQERVAMVGTLIATHMGLEDDEIAAVNMAGLVHDVGKMLIPAEILSKPGRLSAAEMDLIREHPQCSYDILKHISFPWPIADIALQHHERMDGSGYPAGISNGALLLGSRILAVADVVEAMASHRPYRPALGVEAAIQELRESHDKYDPMVVSACVGLHEAGMLGL
jgi:HD-GYP domain-containing protein (c-di-GMP phosphodiesterase class II)